MFRKLTENQEKIKKLNKVFLQEAVNIREAIKKNNLTDEIIKKYISSIENYKKHMLETQDIIIKENPKQTKDKINLAIKDLDVQLNWCIKELEQRKKIRSLNKNG